MYMAFLMQKSNFTGLKLNSTVVGAEYYCQLTRQSEYYFH